MNKNELIKVVSDAVNLTKSDVEKVLNCLASTVVENVNKGDKIVINGLGSFEKVIRAERMGINPSTKQKIKIPQKGVPKFKAAKSFKDSVA